MRHVPTAIYIDTQVCYENNLRFDTNDFYKMHQIFVKGGIRLLIPRMMERELLRHFRKRAKESVEALSKAHKKHPIEALSLLELPPKKELEEKCFESLQENWEKFKEHFNVERLPLVGSIDNVVDWYFQVEAPFSEKKKKEFPDAFILSVLDEYHREHHGAHIAVISKDKDFSNACMTRRYLHNFQEISEYIKAFEPELSRKDNGQTIDPTRPITTEDLKEMKAILGRRDEVTPHECDRVINLLSTRGSNYDYFFTNVNSAFWIDPLLEKGYFANPPNVERFDDGRILIPNWLPMSYLVRVFDEAQDKVINILESLPKTDNPHILRSILEIVIKSDSPTLVKHFYSFIENFIDVAHWGYDKLIELLVKPYIFDRQLIDTTPALLLKIVEFQPDPMAEEKIQRKNEGISLWATPLKPAPRMKAWEYQQILERGILPLAEREPFAVVRVLIDATASMLRLREHPQDGESWKDNDNSEIWYPQLDRSKRKNHEPKVALIHALTTACQYVYERVPESINALDSILRNLSWNIFRRLRHFLYAQHLTEQTFPWIRESILTSRKYGKSSYSYEFQVMIRKACEHFGERLLTEEERRDIFDTILRGPSLESDRELTTSDHTDEAWIHHQHYFYRKQLRPFATVLFKNYRITYGELEDEFTGDQLNDDSYSRVGEVRFSRVSTSSPYSPNELANLSNDELLTKINEWEEFRRDSDDWSIEINIRALAEAFQVVFKDTIASDEQQLNFWFENKGNIERPVYVKAIVQAMQEIIKEQNFDRLDQWLHFCNWVLELLNDIREEENLGSDESRENPDWRSCRRAVGDLVDSCLAKDVNVPLSARDLIADILRKLCSQLDYQLDYNQVKLLKHDDHVSVAINNTRSRALEALVNFGYWVRRYDEDAEISELSEILDKRFSKNVIYPLSLPERAILGLQFQRIWGLDNSWAEANESHFFPRGDTVIWVEAFSAFIKFNSPFLRIFEVLKDDFIFAINHLDLLGDDNESEHEVIDVLGQHLFTYYLWDVYPLQGNNSLLNLFYEKTTNTRSYWARLFDHIGRNLRNTGPELDQLILQRIFNFFDWRLAQKEPLELQQFTFWLEAECLDSEWRLDSYLKILDLTETKNVDLSIKISSLNGLLEQHTAKVVECFAKITDYLDDNENFYFQTGEVKPILLAGLRNSNEDVNNNAKRAQDNLLKAGYFNFLDLDT